MLDLDDYPFTHPPFDHQAEILSKTWDRESWALFLEMGCGKSKLAIDTAGMLYANGEIDTVVVVAKKGEYANWTYTQFPEHLPNQFQRREFLFSTYRYRTKAGSFEFDRLVDRKERFLAVMAINVEALATDPGREAMKRVFASSKEGVMLVVDESTCVKNYKAKRTKEILVWAHKAKYKRIMTGTPVTQSPLDLWGQCMVLGRDMLGFRSYYAFRGRFCEMETKRFGSRSFNVVAKYVNLDELSRILSRFSTILKKEDCLDLPDKLYSQVQVPMTKQQQKLYEDMRELAMVELEDKEMAVTSVLTQVVKLHQICCGQLKFEDGSYESIPNERIPALVELLEDYPGKAIVWANYRQTLADVMKALKRNFGEESAGAYYGGVPDAQRAETVRRFQDPSDPLRFFVSNPQSGGYGLTLTEAKLVVYYSNSYSLEHRLQSEDRAHRIGQTSKVTYVDFVCPNTVDEKIMKALRDKKSLSDMIMEGARFQDLA